MKDTDTKVPVMLGIFFSILSFAFVINAWVLSMTEIATESVHGPGFGSWMISVILALMSTFCYAFDGIISLIKALHKISPRFNIALAVVTLISVPMVLFVGGGLGINILIWNTYHLAIVIMEIISIVMHLKAERCEEESPQLSER